MERSRLGERWLAALLLVVGLALMSVFVMSCEAHAASKASNGAGLYTLKENVTYTKYDITGDGEPDTIRLETHYGWNSYAGSAFRVVINDAYYRWDTDYYEVDAKLIKLKNGTPFLYLRASYDNGDAEVCSIWKYKGDYLKRVVDCNNGFGKKFGFHPGGTIKKVSGNTVTISFSNMSYMVGGVSADFKFKYQNGTLKKTSKIGKLYVGKKGRSYKALKSIKAYKNTKCKSVKFTIKKGQKVSFKKVYVSGNTVRFQVKSGGKTGWIKVAKSGSSSLLYKDSFGMRQPPFKGLHLAG